MPSGYLFSTRIITAGQQDPLAQNRVGLWRARNYQGGSWLDESGRGNEAHFGSIDGVARIARTTLGNALVLPGVAYHCAMTDGSGSVMVTGDIDLRVYMAMEDWTPTVATALMSKYQSVASNSSWLFYLTTTGYPRFYHSDGTTINNITSTALYPFQSGEAAWVRVTWRMSDSRVQFFTSSDGSSWTQLGTDRTVATASGIAIYTTSTPVIVGAYGQNGSTPGDPCRIYRAQIYDGIDGTLVYDANFLLQRPGTREFAESSASAAKVIVRSNAGALGETNYPTITGTRGLYLNGTAGNYATSPSRPSLAITGDIDIRVWAALEDWSPLGASTLISRVSTAGNYSYQLYISTTGAPVFRCTVDGTTFVTATCSVATGVSDWGSTWIRATWRQSDGRVQFFRADDGVTWSQLGTDRSAVVASIFAGQAPLEIGSQTAGTSNVAAGKFYRAQIYNGIDGTKVFDADFTRLPYGTTQFTENSPYSGTVYLRGVTPGTDSGDPVHLPYPGPGYLYLPGVAGNVGLMSDNPFVSITGDFCLRVKLCPTDWTPAATQQILAKRTSNTAISYNFSLLTNGQYRFTWSPNATGGINASATAAHALVEDQPIWVQFQLDVDNGQGGWTGWYKTSLDGVTWTDLGSPVSGAGTTSIYDGVQALEIGSRNSGNTEPFAGKIYRLQLFSDLNATEKRFDADFGSLPSGTTSFVEPAYGGTVNIFRTGTNATGIYRGDRYLYLPGIAGNYAYCAYNTAHVVTGDIEIQVKFDTPNAPPTAIQSLVSRYDTVPGGQRSFYFRLLTTGALNFVGSTDGSSADINISAPSLVSMVGGGPVLVKVTRAYATGLVSFYQSFDNGVSWSSLGSSTGVTGPLWPTTAILELGTINNGTSTPATARLYQARLYNGIDGTKVFDADFTHPGYFSSTFASGSDKVSGTVITIGRSSSGKNATLVDSPRMLYGGTSFHEVAHTSDLDIPLTGSFTVTTRLRIETLPAATATVFAKTINVSSVGAGYTMYLLSNGTVGFRMKDGTLVPSAISTTVLTSGTEYCISGVRDVANDQIYLVINGVREGTVTDTLTTSPENTEVFRFARLSGTSAVYGEFISYGFAFHRRVLSDAECYAQALDL